MVLAGANVAASAEDETRAAQLELIAISVSDVDASIDWYSGLFDLNLIERNDYPNGTTIAFLSGSNLRLEIVELSDAVPFAAPDKTNPASRHGVVKLTFEVGDLDELSSRIAASDTEVLFPLHRSDSDKRCYLTLADPDGTWIQLVGACSK